MIVNSSRRFIASSNIDCGPSLPLQLDSVQNRCSDLQPLHRHRGREYWLPRTQRWWWWWWREEPHILACTAGSFRGCSQMTSALFRLPFTPWWLCQPVIIFWPTPCCFKLMLTDLNQKPSFLESSIFPSVFNISCPKIGSVGCIPLNPWIFIISFIIFLVIFRHLFELLLVVQCWDIFFEQILGVSDYADHYYRHPELWNHQISRIDVHPAYKGRPAAKKYNKMFFVFKADLYKP